jgi:hypothetical protein
MARWGYLFQGSAGDFGIKDVEMGVKFERTSQKIRGLGRLAQAVVDQAGVKQKQRVVGVQGKSLVHRFGRFL